jgi:hypothetical protein
VPHRDLSLDEQENVRACLRVLRVRMESWTNVEHTLPVAHSQLVEVMAGRAEVSVIIAFRVAKAMEASIYDVIDGQAIPANTCRHCGRGATDAPAANP